MSQLKRYNGSSWETIGGSIAPKNTHTSSTTDTYSCDYINEKINDEYIDISSLITKNAPSDLEIVSGYAKKTGTNTTLQIVLRSNTGFTSGGSASYIFTLPADYRPSILTLSTCRLHGDYSYSSWDGTNTGSTIGYLRIETGGTVYVRFPTVSGVTMKAIQIHITY